MKKQAPSLNKLQGSRINILEKENLICKPLNIDRSVFKQNTPDSLKEFKNYHNKFGKSLNSTNDKYKFVDLVTKQINVKLNCNIKIV